ncbi:phage holin family protein [Clostridium sp. SYSU_GA19001]|uniref:phage holin family protein n=1 Tax=Clostridium caldaquaticum TaxID=2940653 RepID=UPI002076E920|nr:phage holin family protein [Clostridium caldaquaticum]MCM8710280.1 phage holin family protein [Clostridium caldaquaticum]
MENRSKGFGIGHMIVRIVVSAVVLAIVAFLTPGFTISGIWPLLLAAIVIGVIDYLIEKITGFDASPFGRGIIGFIVSAAIIYFTGYIVSGFSISIGSAIIAAVIIGVINIILPGRAVL